MSDMKRGALVPIAQGGDCLWRKVSDEEVISEVKSLLHKDFDYMDIMVFEAESVGEGVSSIKKGFIGVKSEVLDEKFFLKQTLKLKAKESVDNLYSISSMQFDFFLSREEL